MVRRLYRSILYCSWAQKENVFYGINNSNSIIIIMMMMLVRMRIEMEWNGWLCKLSTTNHNIITFELFFSSCSSSTISPRKYKTSEENIFIETDLRLAATKYTYDYNNLAMTETLLKTKKKRARQNFKFIGYHPHINQFQLRKSSYLQVEEINFR